MYSFGKIIRIHLFGKSHAACIGCVLEGLPPGVPVSEELIAADMALRRPAAGIGTPRQESDRVRIMTGTVGGKTDGTPLLLMIDNENTDGSAYAAFRRTPRPGHADLPALVKDPDYDIRGGGPFSGRMTAPLVAAGSIARLFLETKGIFVSAFTRSVGCVSDDRDIDLDTSRRSVLFKTRACSEEADRAFEAAILDAAHERDSVGGVVECLVTGLPVGFGGIWFEALDAEIAHAAFGIPAVKGIEFGDGFGLAGMRGSESNDPYVIRNGRLETASNHMGGIVGGMSTGMPLRFRIAFKPTPSIGRVQTTVDLETMTETTLEIGGRHDPCIVPRAVSVVEAVTALVVADQLMREPTRCPDDSADDSADECGGGSE